MNMTKNTKKLIEDENAKWLSQYRERIERRDRTLKHAATFIFYFAIAFFIAFVLGAMLALSAFGFAFLVTFVAFFFLTLAFSVNSREYAKAVIVGIICGIILGLIISIVYTAPMISVAQYPISMQVLYSNTTIIQNCTVFTNTNSGYINGQPIGSKNTTSCSLPSGMAPNESNPFGCSIANKSIICTGTSPTKNVTWQGTILNVSKR